MYRSAEERRCPACKSLILKASAFKQHVINGPGCRRAKLLNEALELEALRQLEENQTASDTGHMFGRQIGRPSSALPSPEKKQPRLSATVGILVSFVFVLQFI